MHRVFKYFIAGVWILNGLVFKIFDLIPRHKAIVSELLSQEWADSLIVLIGTGETILGILILLNWKPKFLAIVQVILILSMNLIEFFFIQELLLFGPLNLLFSVLLSLAILIHQDLLNLPFKSLKNHPFRMKAHFRICYVFTFSLPVNELNPLIMKGLTLDSFKGQFAFYTLAIVDTQQLRPTFLPKFLGGSFKLIGHRIFVKLKAKSGKLFRGLQIIKSETNSLKMKIMGNLFTHYNYQKQSISIISKIDHIEIKAGETQFKVSPEKADEQPQLPKDSPFSNWNEAKKFAGPMPFTFSDLQDGNILLVEGKRESWKAKPLEVQSFQLSSYSSTLFPNAKLASAFKIENVNYKWQKGQIISI